MPVMHQVWSHQAHTFLTCMNEKQTEESNMVSNMTFNNANGIIIMMMHLLAIVSGQQGLPCFHKSTLRNARE